MFDLENAVKKWKQGLSANQAMEEGYITELEGHLRDRIEELTGQDVGAEEAFRQVVNAMGKTSEIGGEYYKAHTVRRSGRPPWQPPPFVPALLWNYAKVAARAVRREKLYTFINISGLSIGMACFMLIGLWVKNELSFDRFHENKERIFRVLNQTRNGQLIATPTYALAPELKNSYPEVEEFSRVWSWQASLVTFGKRRFQEFKIGLADPGFFRMFSFPFVEGNAETALQSKNSVVLIEATARKYFGQEKALGKTLLFDQYQSGFTVSGVMRDIPANSHIQFDMLARVELLGEDRLARWQEWTGPCYILLRPGVTPARFSDKIKDIYKKHIAKDVTYVPVLQELTKVNLEQSGRPDNIMRILLFSLVAVFILLLACINFINLLTARSARRAREIGLTITMEHPAWPESFRRARIIGVVRDFHSRTVHTAIRPFVFRMYRPWHFKVFVKIDGRRTAAALRSIERTFKRHASVYPFEFMTSDEAYQRQYTLERVIKQLLMGFTLLALLIACLGLFGLTAFTIEQKSKEVGVRRVFGASIPNIAWTNIAHFLRWVVIAQMIAWPLAYYMIHHWLRQFAYPVHVGPGLFAQSAILTLVVTLLTVCTMSVRAARANPVNSLRYE